MVLRVDDLTTNLKAAADLGVSQPMVVKAHDKTVPANERVGQERPILVVHIDQPDNDFNTLFDVLHRDPEDPSKFMFYEKFESKAALDAHIASPHFQKFVSYREQHGDPAAVTTVTRWTLIS